jgi:CRISPR-associated endoribonuclease Cas6
MNELFEGLYECLAAVLVRAWRVHLDTPGVRATVPMLRGVWGAALRRLDANLYAWLFEGSPTETPRYVIRPAPSEAIPAPALEFLLFGPHSPVAEEVVWAAWEEALRTGLGPERRPARLLEVRPLAWDGTPLSPSRRQPGFALADLTWPAGEVSCPCRLDFPAPLRMLRDHRLIEAPALPDLVIAALRRLQALAPEPARLWERRNEWLEVARSVPADAWEGRPLELVRYSGRQQRELTLEGVVGGLTLPAGPGPLADLLTAATWLHLGKGTVMGLGQLIIGPTASGNHEPCS